MGVKFDEHVCLRGDGRRERTSRNSDVNSRLVGVRPDHIDSEGQILIGNKPLYLILQYRNWHTEELMLDRNDVA